MVLLLLARGEVIAASHDSEQKNQVSGLKQFSPDSQKNDAQTQIEQAAEHFDAFSLQMPLVIKAKFESFMKHGFRAVLLEDSETKPAEEKMIQSLTRGLRSIGNALEEDMENYRRRSPGDNIKNIESEYHQSSSVPSNQKH